MEFSAYSVAKLLIWSLFWSLILAFGRGKIFLSMHSCEFWNRLLRKLPSLTIHIIQAVTLPVPETSTAGPKAPSQQAALMGQWVLSPYTFHSQALRPHFLPVWSQFSFGAILYISSCKAIYSQHSDTDGSSWCCPVWARAPRALCCARGWQLKAPWLRVQPPRAPCAPPTAAAHRATSTGCIPQLLFPSLLMITKVNSRFR